MANGSLREVETQVMIAERLGYIKKQAESELLGATAEIGKLLNGLCNSLKKRLD